VARTRPVGYIAFPCLVTGHGAPVWHM
jgi:hypothetical protein